jgi:hypothetical protein
MRPVAGLTLTGLGTFFIVVALLMRFYLPAHIVKFPLNWYYKNTLTGHGLIYFSNKKLAELGPVSMTARSVTKGDVAAGSSTTAVWTDITQVYDDTSHLVVSYTAQRSAFDRRTGALVDCCGAYVISSLGVSKAAQSGQGYVFPIGTAQQTYPLFNQTTGRAFPAVFVGTSVIDGVTTDEFLQTITNAKFGSVTVPGTLAGSSAPKVILGAYLTATNTYWVDPITGGPIKISENQTEALEDSTGATKLILFQGTLTSSPQSIQANASTSSSYHFEIIFLQIAGPIIAAGLGIILLVVGIIMMARAPRAAAYAGRGHEDIDDGGGPHGRAGDGYQPEDTGSNFDSDVTAGRQAGSEQADSTAG